MTHSGGKPHAVGDNGQQYEVRVVGYPKQAEMMVVGWTDNLAGAVYMMETILKAPGATSAVVYDRQLETVVTMRVSRHAPFTSTDSKETT